MADVELHIRIDKAPAVFVSEVLGQQNRTILSWELSKYYQGIKHIRLDNVLQYFTSMEADTALRDAFNSLKIGGTVEIICEDFDAVVVQWQNAVWDEISIRDSQSDARQAFARLFGTQKHGNPMQANYHTGYPDTFKSAYNSERLHFLLERAGFIDVAVNAKDGVLIGRGQKTMQRGERQIAKNLSGIRPDHINRYSFAKEQLLLVQPSVVLDLACGIGYGTALLAEALKCRVVGVDLDNGAIQYAKQHYSRAGTEFIQADARFIEFETSVFDAVVSFETIEHVSFDLELLQKFHYVLKSGGTLIISTPNQDVMPFDKEKFAFHLKHYRNEELLGLLAESGFCDIELFKQDDAVSAPVQSGSDGCFTIVVAKKI